MSESIYEIAWAAAFVAWFAVGCISYVFWWTTDYDFTTTELPIMVFSALFLGPMNFLVGWIIHGWRREKMLIRKRTTRGGAANERN
ncbi:hypothetical protein [Burkholderia glumae]